MGDSSAREAMLNPDVTAAAKSGVDSQTHIILPEIPEEKHFLERLASLFDVSCIRLSRILETAQYALLYACICMPIGIGIDRIFNNLYPSVEEDSSYTSAKQLWQAVGVAVLQVILSAISIIYIRKIADLVPFLFSACPSRYVAHYHVDEVFGEAAIALVFVGVQTSLIKALDNIRGYFASSHKNIGENKKG
jgi:hypothetical protein